MLISVLCNKIMILTAIQRKTQSSFFHFAFVSSVTGVLFSPLSLSPRMSLCAPWRYSAPSDGLGSGAPVVRFIDGTQMQLTNKIKLCVSAEPARKNTSCSCEERNHTGWVYMSPQESLQLTAGVFFLTFAHSTEVLCSNHSFSLSLHISISISIEIDMYMGLFDQKKAQADNATWSICNCVLVQLTLD